MATQLDEPCKINRDSSGQRCQNAEGNPRPEAVPSDGSSIPQQRAEDKETDQRQLERDAVSRAVHSHAP